jgi:quinohemoprotein ethanol dehydrogenase
MVYIETDKRPAGLIEGNFTVAGLPPQDYEPQSLKSLFGPLPSLHDLSRDAPPGSVRSVGVLKAWDPTHQKLAWERPMNTFWNGGVMSTGGGIVVQGDARGILTVYDAVSGRVLKALDVGTSMMGAPMTYRAGGKQYIAVMAGYGGGAGLSSPFPEQTAAHKYGNAGRIIAFAVGGAEVPKPPLFVDPAFVEPPPRTGTPPEIAHGEILYNRFCARCHTFGRGELPDLRRLSPATHAIFYDIVLKGLYAPMGMGRWDDVLSRKSAEDLHSFLVEQAWDAYTQQESARGR